ncbi:unnamed protein product [Closterium sp. NIES-54]
MLRVFGCMVQYRPHTAGTGKFEDRARWGIHLGIESVYHAWTILNFTTHQLTRSMPRLWQQHLHTVLIELGFQQLPHDQGMYRLESRGNFILLVVYVDGLLYPGDNTELLDRFEHDIKEKLKVTIDHDVTQFLCLNVTQTANKIHLSAAKYGESLAKKFGIAPIGITTPFCIPPPNHEPVTTPLPPADHPLYQQQLECLLFAVVTCRPDRTPLASLPSICAELKGRTWRTYDVPYNTLSPRLTSASPTKRT